MAEKIQRVIYLENTSFNPDSKKGENHYKFYRVTLFHDDTDNFLAEWGRIGTVGQPKEYPIRKLNEVLDKRENKRGYDRISDETFPETDVPQIDEMKKEGILHRLNKLIAELSDSNFYTPVREARLETILNNVVDNNSFPGDDAHYANRLWKKINEVR